MTRGAASILLLTVASLGAPPDPAYTRYCLGCHNTRVKTGGFSIDNLTPDNTAAWEKVVRKLRTRSMPPAGLPRPDERTYKSLLASLEAALDKHPADPGRTDTFRRLNRTEYQNAIRDLLALDIDVTAMLPADDASHGFDNITVGELSPTLLERYLSAARRISRLAIGTPSRSPGGDTFTLPPDLTQEDHFEELPLGTRGGTAVRYTFPLDATYEFQVRLARDRNEHVEGLRGPSAVELRIDGTRVRSWTVRLPAAGQDHSVVDKDLNIRVPVKAGPHTVAVTFPRTGARLIESERQPWHASFNMDRHPRIQPALYSVSINGPYEAQGPGDTPSRRRVLVCSEQDTACARRILATLGRRAYRRPITGADLQPLLRFFEQGSKDGGFDAGVEMALSAVLVSPEFLFRIEDRLGDIELASRLSFFVWSSIPDDELLAAAERGQLRDPSVLQAHVTRMLADKRADALATNFAGQWLHLRNLSSITPDMRLFPDFDDNLRRAFRRETELLVESVFREDRSILDLLRADYTYLNERLAKHYGIPNIYGSRFRRVHFGENGPRGGLLRQGSILTVTSYATRTSPVIRGKWVLDNIIGVPPPPPPPSVPALKENTTGMKAFSVRERLAEHRKNPACSGCHNLMDPVGFAFENYDAVGRWRTRDSGVPVDASGGLPDGSKADGLAGLQKGLLANPEWFATTFTEKLLTYALGRGVEHFDGPALRKIVREAQAKDFRFSAFVTGIVNSTPFQMRRAQ